MIKATLWVGAALALVSLAAGAGHSKLPVPAAPHSSVTQAPAAMPAWGATSLRKLALEQAAHLGDPAPGSIRFVRTTRQQAARVLDGARVDSDEAVYLVIMQGHFTHEQAFMPPGAQAPTGSTAALTVRAADGVVTDFVLNNLAYDIGQLGAVVAITNG